MGVRRGRYGAPPPLTSRPAPDMIRRLLIAAVLAPALASAQQPATWKFSGTADAGFVASDGSEYTTERRFYQTAPPSLR